MRTALCAGLSAAVFLGMTGSGAFGVVRWSVRQMLVMYSFTWAGLTIGLIPAGRLFSVYAREWREGVDRSEYDIPRRYRVFLYVVVILMGFAAFLLAT
ncbi:hypothetical protein OG974_28640 [Streptomyces sp. NBC_00597]|uniref:hypothetical protein n=1 Tax=Streptomyces sp. NBC_00597 TaxID=2975786 RepID=UPI0030E3D890